MGEMGYEITTVCSIWSSNVRLEELHLLVRGLSSLRIYLCIVSALMEENRVQGFQDTGIRTSYLQDLWVFSLTE